MEESPIFNPLDKRNLGKSVVEALLEAPEKELAKLIRFKGAGIYALYYRGSLPIYSVLSAINAVKGAIPIYVGKAIPPGGRKGALSDAAHLSNAIWLRLKEHADSIKESASLDVADFTFRSLVVDDIWIPLGETYIIHSYRPLWNVLVEGFGNHTPGNGRFNGRRPLWDELHPGRSWAVNCKPPKKTRDEIVAEVEIFMKKLATKQESKSDE